VPVAERRDVVPLREAARAWWAISLRTFGGPAGQIAVMHRELVDERRWIGERRFLHALSFCTLLPGPEAQQLAIYLGWLLNGTAGGLIAGTLFVLPGFVAILGLSVAYVRFGGTLALDALFAGVAPAVVAIVAQAVVRLGRRALVRPSLVAVAVAAFAALAAFAVPFPFVIAGAAVAGVVAGRGAGSAAGGGAGGAPRDAAPHGAPAPLVPDEALHEAAPAPGRAVRIVLLGAALWVAPVVAAAVVLGRGSVLVDQGRFFGATALVTVGGAYAVLTFVAQRAVEVHGWLAPGQMVDGLAMAESTPGPLIMVVQFVGFVGAHGDPGSLDPWVAAVLASIVVTWVTFVPCFVFIFVGAPHVERLRGMRRLSAALEGVTAAVVGVIANLALFFALHTWFGEVRDHTPGPFRLELPVLSTLSPRAVALSALAGFLVVRRGWGVVRVLAACAAIGGAWHVLVA